MTNTHTRDARAILNDALLAWSATSWWQKLLKALLLQRLKGD